MVRLGAARFRAFVYDEGKLSYLDSLVDAAAGWKDLQAVAINDSGQIAGFGTPPDGGSRAFLLTPLAQQRKPH